MRRPSLNDVPQPSFLGEVAGIALLVPVVLLVAVLFGSCASVEYQAPVELREDPAAQLEVQHRLSTDVAGYHYSRTYVAR